MPQEINPLNHFVFSWQPVRMLTKFYFFIFGTDINT